MRERVVGEPRRRVAQERGADEFESTVAQVQGAGEPGRETAQERGADEFGREDVRERRVEGASVSARRARSTITKWRMRGVGAAAVIMVIGGLVGLMFFARPTTSSVEMRNLTVFPAFTVEGFKDGSFFSDLSLWYADTYPLREPMVAADHALDSLFGVSVNGGMVGGNVAADEIPVSEEPSGDDQSDEDAAQETQPKVLIEAPDERVIAEDVQANIMEGVYVQDGAGYSIYYFDQSAADTYIAAMNTAAQNLDGVSTVYSIMSPANSITLDDETMAKVGGSDQQQTLGYLASRYDSRVHQVEIVDDIMAHRDEYLYFYTDHHWTQIGAYYAYVAFCNEKGIEPHELSYWRHENFGEFEGTYYDTIAGMGEVKTDTVDAYFPSGTNTMRYWPDGSDGEEVEAPVVDEGAFEWDSKLKYSCFIRGDQPLSIIDNPAITDGSSCLVVKDSYGDAFAPLLVDSYQHVHIIDFRYTDKNICEYARDNDIDDVIFMTGMKIGLTETVAATLLSEVS